jgi:hypothetical protein
MLEKSVWSSMESPEGCLHPELPGGYHRIKRMEAFWENQNTLNKSVPPDTLRECTSNYTKKNLGAFHVWANEMNE